MARKAKAKSTGTSSWWDERSKILSKKTETRPAKAAARKAKGGRKKAEKAEKAEKGKMYYCEVCGCEIVCVSPGAETVACCGEPMLLVV